MHDTRTKLDEVTLCCIDTAQPAAALRALRLSQGQCKFARTLFLTSESFAAEQAPRHPEIKFQGIAAIEKGTDYSRLIMKELGGLITTPFVLIVQWDGYVLDGSRWSDDFLKYDYIGSIWPAAQEGFRVGNGGFSLRSRKLLDALARPEFPCSDPEDMAICIIARPTLEALGIRFANEETASRFSYEQAQTDLPTFGFHGIFNLCKVLGPEELEAMLNALPPRVLEKPSMAELIKGYFLRGRWSEASMVLQRMEASLDSEQVLRTLSQIADGDVGKAKVAQMVIHDQGRAQANGQNV